ncbi:MAG: hypothetical protein FJW14_08740 [Acidimicrobiia bacterium]|nr:hypothetical protein [Acidimicrobiia bacterium]
MAAREDQEKRIKAAIARIAEKPRSVLFSEIDWVMTHLRTDLGYKVRRTGDNQHYTYVVNELPPFQVCDHHKGQKEVKSGYVKGFLSRMIDLGLLEGKEDND